MSRLTLKRSLLRPLRAGATAPFGPGGVSTGLILWLKADSLIGFVNNDLVPSYLDSSGVGNHFGQSGADSLKPIYHTAQVNGLPAIYYPFVTNNSHQMSAPWQGGAPTTSECFAIAKADNDPASDPSAGFIWSFGTSFADVIVENTGDIRLGWGTNTRPIIGNPVPSMSSWRRLNIWSAPNDYSFQIDTVNFYLNAVNTVAFATNPLFSGSTPYMGHIAEYIQYNRKLSAGERTSVDNYLKAKYNLP